MTSAAAPARSTRPTTVASAAAASHAAASRAVREFLTAVAVFDADHVVELGGRDLEEERVLERVKTVDCPRRNMEAPSGADARSGPGRSRRREHDLGISLVEVDRLILHPMVLQAELLAGTHEEDLPAVAFG